MHRFRFIAFFIAAVAVFFAGCSLFNPTSDTSYLASEMETPSITEITVHMTIDDQVIDKGDVYAIIDPVFRTGNIFGSVQEYNDSLKTFSQEQRYIFAVFWHLLEVNNGGHDQFYSNSTGIVWQDAISGYKAIGLEEAVTILEESAMRMGGRPSLVREERWEQLDSLLPDFEDLDDRFYKLQETIDFDDVMMTYIKSYPSAFYFDGDVKK